MKVFNGEHHNYIYHSDLSGPLEVHDMEKDISIECPWHEILSLVAERIRDTQIAKAEQSSDEELLGIKVYKDV